MTKEQRLEYSKWPVWLLQAWNKDRLSERAIWPESFSDLDGKSRLCIGTLEGTLTVEWDDYIIQGVEGELYPCKPDIFKKTYNKET